MTSKPMTFYPPHSQTKSVWNAWDSAAIHLPQMLNIPQTSVQAKPVVPQVPGPQGPHPYSLAELGSRLERSRKSLTEHNSYSSTPHKGKCKPLCERATPIYPAPGDSPNHVDDAYFLGSSPLSSSDNEGSGGAVNHISGNKIGWEKTGSRSQPPARETQETKQS
ncbi:Constitutive coactivator of PPAR-gamma-like protein 1 [Manis javanica]|nr:Constitutive coactivator of PPAR-gamma-like protein 1 [Manis javanica]